MAIAGFIAGIALQVTKGRYNQFPYIAGAAGISAGEIFVIGFFGIPYISIINLINISITAALSGLIILPILLFMYSAITRRRKRA